MSIQRITLRAERNDELVPPAPNLVPVASYTVSGSVRGLAERHEVELKANHIVELNFEDEGKHKTTWLCNRDTLEDIFPQAAATPQGRGSDDAGFELPMTLSNTDAERGAVGNLLLKTFKVFAKTPIEKKVKEIAQHIEEIQLEHYSGLYRLSESFQFQPFTPEADDKPYLLLLHGTGSSTKGSFGELAGTALWQFIRQTYGANVLAFQHETLSKSPLQNARELAAALPSRISLDIISHSRGGLVGDVLCRFCNGDENNTGFTAEEKAYLTKVGDREYDLDELQKLREAVAGKRISVRRFVRVACPAAGTVLASKRLDNFLNIILNLIGYGTGAAASPVYSLFKELIGEVVGCKNESASLPGLEAMNPESPFIKVLNSPASAITLDSPLAVVSGNCRTSVNLKGLLIIASKLFYLQDNDLVVNTTSMYLGAKRQIPAQYFFDETAETDHFHYFKNKRTNTAIQDALSTAVHLPIPGFSAVRSGTGTRAERNAALSLEGGHFFCDTVTGTRPIAVLLPGIMGSNITRADQSVWINYLKFITGGLMDLSVASRGMKAPSLIKTSYKKLADFLSKDYDVVTFPFDWRLQLNTQAALFNKKIRELMEYGQPIKIIGHSMGGVLVRDFIINHDDTWQALNRSAGFRLLFLGSPLGGSFRIPAVVFGKDAIIDKLSKIDIVHTKKELLEMFSKMPGLLSLLPLTEDTDNDFARTQTWERMRVEDDWPLPTAGDLATFAAYRARINASMRLIDYSNMAYIAGKDKATPCAYRMDDTAAGREITFLSTAEGDQSVTWATGIPPEMIRGGSVYYVNVTHGALSADPSIFKGIADLLANKTTNLLSQTRPVVRGEEQLFKAPLQQDFDLSPEGVERTILGLDDTAMTTQAAGTAYLAVRVSQGDLRYADYPVLAGHFKDDGVLYAEKSIDYNLHGALTYRHRLGLYPGDVGTSEIIVAKEGLIKGAVIAGLGLPGSLTSYRLTLTVEQAVCNYLLRYNGAGISATPDAGGGAQGIGISSLMIGCGYGGLSVYSAVRAIAEGVQAANNKMRAMHGEGAATVQNLEFIEQYEDRALSCFHTLSRIEGEESGTLAIRFRDDQRKIKVVPGSRKRLPTEAMQEWWNRITVRKDKSGDFQDKDSLFFSASTGGAREEVRELFTSTPLIEELLKDISVENRWTPELAKTIFELLIPNDFKEQLKKQCHINWILDEHTAGYPWELLQDATVNAKPLCINAGMIRQLATPDYRTRINPVSANTALVIAEPQLDGFLPRLEGAKNEGELVQRTFTDQGFDTTSCINERTGTILQALMSKDYKIIHLAGHGLFDEAAPDKSGMAIGNGKFLSSRQIGQISNVPELVFVNCCYLGSMDGEAERESQQRYRLAANIGTQLINNGVKAVVAAGWAVNDEAALHFAEVFYKHMFAGHTFGTAVQKARKAVYDRHGASINTWGAYQCYGDPFYRLTAAARSEQETRRYDFIIGEEAEIELNNLTNALDMGDYGHDDFLKRVAAIGEAADRAGIRNAVITELEANIYAELNEYDLAIARFESLLKMQYASFSFTALERYCHIRAKKYVLDFVKSSKPDKTLVSKMARVIEDMDSLIRLCGPTAPRYSIMGSIWVRSALIAPTVQEQTAAFAKSAFFYQKAAQMQAGAYEFSNWYALESILVLAGKHAWKTTVGKGTEKYELPDIAEVVALLTQLRKAADTTPEDLSYWDMLADANIDLCLLLLNNTDKQAAWDELLRSYHLVWQRAGGKGKKQAETEYLELLAKGLSLGKSTPAKALLKRILYLKAELEKFI